MVELVSVHGGHSGEFCGHATDTLSDVVQAYFDAGFRWVCLTEHMAPHRADLTPADEAPLDLERINARFSRYFAEARRRQTVARSTGTFDPCGLCFPQPAACFDYCV